MEKGQSMKVIFKDYETHTTLKDLQVGELFSFESDINDINTERPYVLLKLTKESAFDLFRNEVGKVPVNLSMNSAVKRVKGYLVVEGVEV